jgi:NAD(P)H-flavin reductase
MSMVRKIRCRVERVDNHGDQVYTVDLRPERTVPVFQPGQFLHFTLDEYDPSGFWPESRVFSIASSPKDRDRLRIIYSVKGVYTTRMEQELAAGRGVWVKLPYGEFVVQGGKDAVLIAGGTGISAFQAFIDGLSADHPNKVVLLYGARSPDLLLGWQGLCDKMREAPNFRAIGFAETIPPGSSPEARGTSAGLQSGRINLAALGDCVGGESAVYYLAGPPAMLSAFRPELKGRGVAENCICVDAWE